MVCVAKTEIIEKYSDTGIVTLNINKRALGHSPKHEAKFDQKGHNLNNLGIKRVVFKSLFVRRWLSDL